MRISRSAAAAGMILVLGGLNACGSDNSVGNFAPVVPKTLTITPAANGQTGFVTDTLNTQLSVTLTDANGLAVIGSPVVWTVTSGGGSVSSTAGSTNAFGVASTIWTLGDAPGAQAVTVASQLVSTVSGSFSATAVAPTFGIKSGNNQTAAASDTVANPLTISVTDASAAPVKGVRVDFAVTSGGGFFATADSAKTTSVTTDVNGEAAIGWVLGPTVGAQSATAKVGTASPVTFTAVAN
ncbi:MAG: hypothetical protein ACREMS_12915 [Gemmatimonadaceae bacterium]